MAIRKVERGEWDGFCQRVSRYDIGMQAVVEVMSTEFGCQVEVHRLPMIGMTYDVRNDMLELAIGELDHLIRAPREVYVDDSLGTLSLQIVDAAGVRQVITLRGPLLLPAPGALPELRA